MSPIQYPPTVVVAYREGFITAFHGVSGKMRWRFKPHYKADAIVFGDNAIYAGSHAELRPNGVDQILLTALNIGDGSVRWQTTALPLGGNVYLAAEGETLFVRADRGDKAIYALAMRTGEIIWKIDAVSQRFQHVVGTRAGKVYVFELSANPFISARDVMTGQELWRFTSQESGTIISFGAVMISENGAFVALQTHLPSRQTFLTMLNAVDGSVLNVLPLQPDNQIVALTDDGIAYILRDANPDYQLYALRIADGKELWQTGDDMAPGPHRIISRDHLYLNDHTICYVQNFSQRRRGEVGLLDAATGRQLWRWQSPDDLPALLTLWRWRIFGVIGHVLHEGCLALQDWRGRRRFDSIRFELARGQWRHPADLNTATNAMTLIGKEGRVYLTTSLGLFALRLRDGAVLWLAMPATDLSMGSPIAST